MKTVLTLVACMFLASCAGLARAPVPIGQRIDAARCGAPVDTLLVLLPGAFDRPSDFIDEGFVDAVRRRGIAADIAIVDATLPYYRQRSIADRLDLDVVAPARARGMRHVWIAGISLGGLGALIHANEKPGPVDGLLLIAPYLGERTIVAEVAASGGLVRWSPPGAIPPDDDDRRIWRWLQDLSSAQHTGTPAPRVWLGYGVDDRLAEGHRLLAAALPTTQVFTAPGGHDWPAWRAVWDAMLDAAPLPRSSLCEGRR